MVSIKKPDEKKRLAVFCSGNGSNFKALHKRIREKHLPCDIVLCLSNNSQCGAMTYARENNIDAVHLSTKTHPIAQDYTNAMLRELQQHRIDLILLAGYMKKIPNDVIKAYPKKILNIHPSLLPKFGGEGMFGLHVHQAVVAAKEPESGATVHFVDADYDTGEVILQRRVPVLPDDSPESLAERVLAVEHQLYADALEKILSEA